MTKFAKGNNSKEIFFLYFYQVIYSLLSISRLSLKLLAIIVFEISWLQVFNAKICKGQYFEKIHFYFELSPGYELIIFYQLTKFEATCCNSF